MFNCGTLTRILAHHEAHEPSLRSEEGGKVRSPVGAEPRGREEVTVHKISVHIHFDVDRKTFYLIDVLMRQTAFVLYLDAISC